MRSTPWIAGLALALAGCGELDRFDIPIEGTLAVVGSPVEGVALPEDLPFAGMESPDFRKAFADNGASIDDVESVKLSSLRISVQPEGANLDFLDGIEFFIEAAGQQRRRIAALDPVPDGVDRISLEVTGAELKPWITADDLTITAKARGVLPTEDVTLRAKAIFEVDAGLL